MDLVRAGLGYLARADVASLPAVTQARLLREYERAQSQHTAGRVRALSAFTAQGGYADDGHGGSASVAGLADPGHGQGRVRDDRVDAPPGRPPAGRRRAGRGDDHRVVRPEDLLLVGSAARRLPGRWPTRILADAAAGGADLDFLSQMAEEMFSRVTPPDKDDEDDARFHDRFFRLTRLFQGHGRADGDLTPECLAAVTEVLDTLGKKAGPEDDRSAGQRGHDALEEAMRLLLASGCLPERAGQAAQVQLHLTLDELLDMPGGTGAASAWLAHHLAASTSGDGGGSAASPDAGRPGHQPAWRRHRPDDPQAHRPGTSQPGAGAARLQRAWRQQPGPGVRPARPG